jgi:hypothetical protein
MGFFEVERHRDQRIGFTLMSILAFVINERVVSFGKVLKPREIIKIPEGVRK